MAVADSNAAPMAEVWLPALGQSVARVARETYDIEAVLEAEAHSTAGLSDVLTEADLPCLYYPLDLADGRRGLCRLDGHLVNALIEILTGAPDRAVLRDARPATRTDATLCRDFVERVLKALADTGVVALDGAKVAAHETLAVRLYYALTPGQCTTIGGKVAFQAGIRGGGFQVSLPSDLWQPQKTASAAPTGWASALSASVMAANYPLRAVLDRQSLPLERLVALRPGDKLVVAQSALSMIELADLNGRVLLKGCLGQFGLRKAVRLSGALAGMAATAPESVPTAPSATPQAEAVADDPPADTADRARSA